jgi:hypothetical protein
MCRPGVTVNSIGISYLLFLVVRRKRVWNETNIISHSFKVCPGNLKGIDHLENLDVYGSLILGLRIYIWERSV